MRGETPPGVWGQSVGWVGLRKRGPRVWRAKLRIGRVGELRNADNARVKGAVLCPGRKRFRHDTTRRWRLGEEQLEGPAAAGVCKAWLRWVCTRL